MKIPKRSPTRFFNGLLICLGVLAWIGFGEVAAQPAAGLVAAEAISWEDAHRYYGEIKTVEGVIVKTHNSRRAVFLNFHPNWKRYFTVVIFARDFNYFPKNPEKFYLQKRVRVTGRIKEYKGKPEMVIQSPKAMEVLPSGSDARQGNGQPRRGTADRRGVSSWDNVLVEKVMDGDTLHILYGGNRHSVRLIGVDTPEVFHPMKAVQYFGREATQFTRTLAEGKAVRLEFDWERTDKYGRVLAYVTFPDGRLLNAEIIRQGYGFAYAKYPFRMLERFRRLEAEARAAGKGLWADDGRLEVQWLRKQGRIPIRLSMTPQCDWVIHYRGYVKQSVKATDLPILLEHLRLLIHALAPKDLMETLRSYEWHPEERPAIGNGKRAVAKVYGMTNRRWGFVYGAWMRLSVKQSETPQALGELRGRLCGRVMGS